MTVRSAPRLETERLILRQFDEADFDAHLAIMQDPGVNRFLGPPKSREEIWRGALCWVGMWSVIGIGGWMVERKFDGRLVGHVGLLDAKRDLGRDMGGKPEMGWIFAREVHAQGIAREACEAVLEWIRTSLGPTALWAMISVGNDSSLKLARRLGFEPLGDYVYRNDPVILLERPISSG